MKGVDGAVIIWVQWVPAKSCREILEAKGVLQYDDNEEDENWGNSCSELTGN